MNIYSISVGRPKKDTANGVLSYAYWINKSLKKSFKLHEYYKTKHNFTIIVAFQILFKYLVSKNKNDIKIIFHGIFQPLYIFLFMFFKTGSVYWYVQGSFNNRALHKSRFRKIIFLNAIKILSTSKKINFICLSNDEVKDVDRLFNKGNKFIIPPPVSQPITILSTEPKKHNTKKIFTYIGRYDPYTKGLDTLVNVAYDLSHLQNIQFNLYGPYSSFHSDVRLIDPFLKNNILPINLKLNDAVYGSKKVRILENTDYFILLSRNEGLPMALIEALSFGIPLIVTKETNILQSDVPCSSIHIVDRNSRSIGDTISKLTNQSDHEYVKQCNTAHDYYLNNFSENSIIEKYEKMFKHE